MSFTLVFEKTDYNIFKYYRDFNNKLHKLDGVVMPLQCSKLPEILYSVEAYIPEKSERAESLMAALSLRIFFRARPC